MKKILLGILSIYLIALLAGCASEDNTGNSTDNETSISSTSISGIEDSESSVNIIKSESSDTVYEIEQNKDKTITIVSTDLKTQSNSEIVNSDFLDNSKNRTVKLILKTNNNTFDVSLESAESEDLSTSTSFTSDLKYIEYVPYNDTNNGKLGVFVSSDNQDIIDNVKENISNISNYLDSDSEAEFYEQSIEIK